MYDYLRIPGVFRNLKLYAGCSNTIHDLLGVYEFIAVTSRPEMHHLDTAIWLGENLPYINDLYFSDEKWLIEGAIIIEDKPSTLIKCQEAQFYTITMDAPYNRYVSGSRVKDWLDVNHLLWSLHYYG